ncbi:MAG: glutaredoxin family protein [Rubrivivax sp.]|nr:glutaredoxin family protein [Rubrivivax sp.]
MKLLSRAGLPAVCVAAGLALAWHAPARAQFKVVNPDGTVTYTDRPPQVVANTRITNMARPGQPTVTEADTSLPPELRQPNARYPVTFYSTSECSPCDTGRQLLVTRGIPYTERRVTSEEDAQAFERLFGTRTLPLLTVGGQALKGLSDVEWTAYLDAAGYPKQSRLPRGWQARSAPMIERAAAAAPATPARTETPAAPPPVVETEEVTTGTRLRF